VARRGKSEDRFLTQMPFLSVTRNRCPRHPFLCTRIQDRSRDGSKLASLRDVIRMGMGNENVSDSQPAFSHYVRKLIRSEARIDYGRLSAPKVSQDVAEIAIPSEMELQEMDSFVAIFIYNPLRH
jgi:hypothetical protein